MCPHHLQVYSTTKVTLNEPLIIHQFYFNIRKTKSFNFNFDYWVSGLANTEGICTNYSVSICQERGEFGAGKTLAHELGHR